MNSEKEKIISDICPLYKEYGTCEQCNTELDIDDEPCYFECVANAIINNGYRKQSEGEWKRVSDKYPRYVCTVCNHLYNNAGYNYCPNCGAKMKGGE